MTTAPSKTTGIKFILLLGLSCCFLLLQGCPSSNEIHANGFGQYSSGGRTFVSDEEEVRLKAENLRELSLEKSKASQEANCAEEGNPVALPWTDTHYETKCRPGSSYANQCYSQVTILFKCEDEWTPNHIHELVGFGYGFSDTDTGEDCFIALENAQIDAYNSAVTFCDGNEAKLSDLEWDINYVGQPIWAIEPADKIVCEATSTSKAQCYGEGA